MYTFISILIATFAITLCVWVATLFVYIKKEWLNKIVVFLVSLSAGSLLGGAFLHLLPESAETLEPEVFFGIFLVSFVCFLVIEKIIHWRHCHTTDCTIHPFGYMNLVGDSIHNFIDGLVIAGAFIVDIKVGIATTIAVALHEIPQEIGDYGVLIYSGMSHLRALVYNYAVSLTVVLGGIVGYFAFHNTQMILPYLLPIAAGGFVYIAASDLVPEMKKETSTKKSIISISIFVAGILLMYVMKFFGEH